MLRGTATTLVLLLTLIGCAPQAPQEAAPTHDPAADRAAIEAAADAWAAGFNAGDAAAVAALYAEDGVLYPPQSPPAVGRAAIQDFVQPMIDMGLQVEGDREETQVDGDLGYNLGNFVLLDAEGGVFDEGHFIEIWTREADGWVMKRDIFNSDLPATDEGDMESEMDG